MKRFFYFALILVLIFCAGCGDDETDKNKSKLDGKFLNCSLAFYFSQSYREIELIISFKSFLISLVGQRESIV